MGLMLRGRRRLSPHHGKLYTPREKRTSPRQQGGSPHHCENRLTIIYLPTNQGDGIRIARLGGQVVKSFVIAQGNEERLELKIVAQLKGKELEDEGFAFGLWLLENASSPFLKGLAEAMDEAEIRKKVGLGY
jgi:hypothetical protein